MGLDMYLTKKTSVKNWDFEDKSKKHEVIVKTGGKIDKSIKTERISEIVEDIGYWRKANAIHEWFVQNVQDGEDNCADYYVSIEDLKKLLTDVSEVLSHKDKAGEILPPQSGFFFGSTDIDEYYYQDLEYTKGLIEKILKEDNDNGSFYYSSSW